MRGCCCCCCLMSPPDAACPLLLAKCTALPGVRGLPLVSPPPPPPPPPMMPLLLGEVDLGRSCICAGVCCCWSLCLAAHEASFADSQICVRCRVAAVVAPREEDTRCARDPATEAAAAREAAVYAGLAEEGRCGCGATVDGDAGLWGPVDIVAYGDDSCGGNPAPALRPPPCCGSCCSCSDRACDWVRRGAEGGRNVSKCVVKPLVLATPPSPPPRSSSPPPTGAISVMVD